MGPPVRSNLWPNQHMPNPGLFARRDVEGPASRCDCRALSTPPRPRQSRHTVQKPNVPPTHDFAILDSLPSRNHASPLTSPSTLSSSSFFDLLLTPRISPFLGLVIFDPSSSTILASPGRTVLDSRHLTTLGRRADGWGSIPPVRSHQHLEAARRILRAAVTFRRLLITAFTVRHWSLSLAYRAANPNSSRNNNTLEEASPDCFSRSDSGLRSPPFTSAQGHLCSASL